jgi:ATP-dependent exoDNAse (exonuclease V) beta subunit
MREAFFRDPDHLPTELLNGILRYLPFEDFLRLVGEAEPCPLPFPSLSPAPTIDGEKILTFDDKGCHSVQKGKALFETWLGHQRSSSAYTPIPSYHKGGTAFQKIWADTLVPLHRWLEDTLPPCLQRISEDYLQFRLHHGKIFHTDTVILAHRLLRQDPFKTAAKDRPRYFLLDEAQDTDTNQWDFIMHYFRLNPENKFSMVGDPQQSIYGSRTSVQHYLNWHKTLIQDGTLEPLTFSTTYRCAKKIVLAIRHFFPSILTEKKPQQVSFVPLTTPAEAVNGHVFRLHITRVSPEQETSDKVSAEAVVLVDWVFQSQASPSDVVFLCPRNRWLADLEKEFRHRNLNFKSYSRATIGRENLFFRWVYVLVHLFVYPEDGFELVGALREWFALGDRDIVDFVYGEEPQPIRRLQILEPSEGSSMVSQALNLLRSVRLESMKRPPYPSLIKAVQTIGFVNRLTALNEMTVPEIEHTWDGIVWETAGSHWGDLEKQLRIGLDRTVTTTDEPISSEGVYRGCSLHKSKGLEWPIVVLPYLFRPFDPHGISYPYFFDRRVVLNETSPEAIRASAYRRAEYERLLYVGMTRAKHTLVLVDDSDGWKGRFSLGQLLLQSEENRHFWHTLPTLTEGLPLPTNFSSEEPQK